MVQGTSLDPSVSSTLENDIASNCYHILGLDPDATFSEIRNSYQALSSLKLKTDMEIPESSPHLSVYLRLLTEFLRDPDIKAQWAANTTHQKSIETEGSSVSFSATEMTEIIS